MSSKQSFPDSFLCKDQIEKSKEDHLPQHSWIGEGQEGTGTVDSILPLKLSTTLVRKLMEKAQVEGVSIEDLASELLAEGLVLRAWEIVEKKNAMRSPSNNPNASNNNHRNQKFGFRSQGHHVKRMGGSSYSHDNGNQTKTARQNYNHIMEDNANFLEYVRNQEKNQDKY